MSSASAANPEDCDRTGPLFAGWWRETGQRELCQLLFWVWDPIGLNEDHFPAAVAEYDGYALEIATALAAGLSVPALAALLSSIEHHRMGLAPRDLDAVAARLLAWYHRSTERDGDPADVEG